MPSWILPNGLRVVHHPLPGRRTTCVGVTLRVGSRDERPGEEGAAHIVEHLAFRDTARFSATQITDLRERMGGGFEAVTEKEFTAYTATVPAGAAWRALDLLASQVREPLFRAEDVARERRIVLQELAEAEEDFEDRCCVLAEELLFGGALGREIAGSRRSVRALDGALIRRFHRRAYSPKRAVVVAVGALDRRRFAREVERLFGDWHGTGPARTVPPALPEYPVAKVLRRSSPSAQVVLAFPGVSGAAGDRELQAQALLSAMLGATDGSRLFRAIRDHAALAYNVESYTSVYSDAGAFAIAFGVAGGSVRRALEISLREARALGEAPTAEEHERAMESLEARMQLDAESAWLIAREEARAALLGRRVASVEDRLGMLRSITLNDVRALARRIFGSPRATLAMVGDPRFPAPQRWLRERLARQAWGE
ncbi:MAG TPA: pitrilysin family protein [Candidatus Dormibacteraeota bacterium]|nr:pitrilysin family protein [Candidatus Dormibacteraeota bacterium]